MKPVRGPGFTMRPEIAEDRYLWWKPWLNKRKHARPPRANIDLTLPSRQPFRFDHEAIAEMRARRRRRHREHQSKERR